MKIHDGYENLKLIAPVATLGIFDGVHRGHMALLQRLVSGAREDKGESVVITFSPHPKMVLDQNKSGLSFLTTMEEKIVLLEKANIDHLIIIEFNNLFSKITACDFIKEILIEKIGVKHLVMGFNHRFGSRGEGDFNTIKRCSGELGFRAEQVPGFQTEEGIISSSMIREALLNGRIDEANRWLGYHYSVTGIIIEGRKIGRTLGFPTANIKTDSNYKLIPRNGVYAVDVHLDDKIHVGMLSIGSNPTVNDDIRLRSIEVYILDFDNEIYGKKISVIFRKKLRNEKKYDNMRQLSEQMQKDLQETKRLLT